MMKFKQMLKLSYHFKTKLHIVIIELSLATKRRRFTGLVRTALHCWG